MDLQQWNVSLLINLILYSLSLSLILYSLEVTLEKSLADNIWSSLLQDNTATATASLPLSDGLDKDFVSSEELTDIEEKLKEMRRKRVSDRERKRGRDKINSLLLYIVHMY